jgi:DNA polymerase-3 subunit delta
MKISLEQLHKELKSTVRPFYILSGEEILLLDEACDAITQQLKKQFALSPQRITISPSFDWEHLYGEFSTPSLFNPVSCFVLSFNSLKLDKQAKDLLTHFAQHTHHQRFIIVKFPKIETETSNAKWFTTLTDTCAWLPIPSILAGALPAWLRDRAKQYRLSLDPQQAQLIAERTDNNLLASDQALKKLQLINKPITLSLIEELIETQAEYDVFLLSDACLMGRSKRVYRILDTLQSQDVAPILILWSLAKDIRTVLQLQSAIRQGQTFSQACQHYRVWSSRQALMQNMLQRSRPEDCIFLLKQLAYIDKLVKGLESGDSWHELRKVCIAIASLPQQTYRAYWAN